MLREDDLRAALEAEADRATLPGPDRLDRLMAEAAGRGQWPEPVEDMIGKSRIGRNRYGDTWLSRRWDKARLSNLLRGGLAAAMTLLLLVGGGLLYTQSPRGVPFQGGASDPGADTPSQATAKVNPLVLVDLPAARIPGNQPDWGQPIWTADGSGLVYLGAEEGRPMRLSLDSPDHPEAVGAEVRHGPVLIGPKGEVLYWGPREGDQVEPSIFLQVGDEPPVDLLPNTHLRNAAIRFHRFLGAELLAFQQGAGTGASELYLLDLEDRRLIEGPRLAATWFAWSPDGKRVVGQWSGGPPHFWIWDRMRGEMIEFGSLPGQYQQFEAWAPDAETILFSAWDGGWPYQGGQPTLYRLGLGSGRVELVAPNAALAAWDGGHLAYLAFGNQVSLVLQREKGPELWREEIGPLQELRLNTGSPEELRPIFAGPYLSYRTLDGDLWVARSSQQGARWLGTGEGVDRLVWAPDQRHLAMVRGDRLLVLQNPFNP